MADLNTNSIHLHIVNDPLINTNVFHIDEARFWQALGDYPELKEHIRVTAGLGDQGFNDALRTATILMGVRFPHREIAKRAPHLKWVHQIGAGIDHLLPLDWLPQHIVLTNSSGVHLPKVGEFTTCALLMLNSMIPLHVTHQRQHRWVKVFSDYIDGKVVLIIGVGRMGGEAARRAKSLGLRVLGIRRSGQPHPHVDEMYRPSELRNVLPRADFVVITAPSTSETKALVGGPELDLMKPTASIVNIARGALLDNQALADRLNAGRLQGAVLDVFDREPLPEDSPLWECKNLIMIPHVSSDAPDYLDRMLRMFAENLRCFLEAKPLSNVVERDHGY